MIRIGRDLKLTTDLNLQMLINMNKYVLAKIELMKFKTKYSLKMHEESKYNFHLRIKVHKTSFGPNSIILKTGSS